MTSSSYVELEHTLEDGAWKDSFDKLLDVKPVLREMNILKKDVRASFNNDSSVENSREMSGLLTVPAVVTKKHPTSISTPVTKVRKYPFKCSISPITQWRFQLLRTKKKKQTPVRSRATMQSTVIHPEVTITDYDEARDKTKEVIQQIVATDTTTEKSKGRKLTKDAAKEATLSELIGQRLSEISTTKDTTLGELLKSPNSAKDATENVADKHVTLSELLERRKSAKKVPGMRQVHFDSNAKRKSSRNCKEQQIKQSIRTSSPTQPRLSKKRSSNEKNKRRKSPPDMTLQPGKWRKSLSCLRRSQMEQEQVRRSSQRNVCRLQAIVDCDESVEFINVIPPAKWVGTRTTILIKPEQIDDSDESVLFVEDYRTRLLEYCNQKEPLPFNDVYSMNAMSDCYKIGEGVYGEVFLKKVQGGSVVCKIIPIEGSIIVNGESQKTFEQILPEVVISRELCNLKDTTNDNATSGFVEIKKVTCIYGKYPDHLIKYWEAYDNEKGSENDHPGDLPDNQIYIVLELEFAGKDLETFVFDSACQSFAALKQIVLTLGVAEQALEFEHRDLHWGNVLIHPTNETEFTYKLSGETLTLPSMGIKATIIDYTLSRVKHKNHCFYNDLTNDEELFTATGDYQFDIYRMMRDILGQNWERFEPKTNIYWISYILTKMINGVKYKITRSKEHTQSLRKMRALRNEVLEYSSACDFIRHLQSA